MTEIRLLRGETALVDDADRLLVAAHQWRVVVLHGLPYVGTNVGGPGSVRVLLMHRLIMDAKRGEQIDHRNGDGLDNRRCNLRRSTQQQNCWNRRPQRNARSQFKGVTWRPERDRWVAKIRRNGVTRQVGSFLTEGDAARAYDAAAVELFGEFAWLNFPESADVD